MCFGCRLGAGGPSREGEQPSLSSPMWNPAAGPFLLDGSWPPYRPACWSPYFTKAGPVPGPSQSLERPYTGCDSMSSAPASLLNPEPPAQWHQEVRVQPVTARRRPPPSPWAKLLLKPSFPSHPLLATFGFLLNIQHPTDMDFPILLSLSCSQHLSIPFMRLATAPPRSLGHDLCWGGFAGWGGAPGQPGLSEPRPGGWQT